MADKKERVARGRHVGYTAAGKPLVVLLPSATCKASLPDFLGLRHVGYSSHGFPLVAYSWDCCDAFCDEGGGSGASGSGGSCYVNADCFPYGPGPGISRTVYLYLGDVANCCSARGKRVKLLWSDPDVGSGGSAGGDGKWHGSITLRGGTLDFTFECVPSGDPEIPPTFRLSWTGCDTGELSHDADCLDPLFITFGQAPLNNCCACRGTESADVAFYVVANCHKVAWARHVGYTSEGTPIVARARPCPYDQGPCRGCPPACTLVATVEGEGDCACMGGEYDLAFTGGVWENLSGWPCNGVQSGTMSLSCFGPGEASGSGNPGPPPGYVRLCLFVTCGATNTGLACVDVKDDETDDLDVTFDVTMTDPEACVCGGSCVYRWNAMAAVWEFVGDTCTCGGRPRPNACDDCPNGPTDNSPGSADGELRSQPCTGGRPPSCCNGTIRVRLTR